MELYGNSYCTLERSLSKHSVCVKCNKQIIDKYRLAIHSGGFICLECGIKMLWNDIANTEKMINKINTLTKFGE